MQPRKRGCLATMREARFGTLVNRCVQQDDDDYVCRQPHQPVPIHPLPRSDSASSPSIWMEPTSSSSSSSSSSSWSQHHHHSHRKEPRDHHCRSPPGCSIIYYLRSLLRTLGLLSSSIALVNVVSEVGLVLEILDKEVEEVCWCFSNSTIGVVGVLLLST